MGCLLFVMICFLLGATWNFVSVEGDAANGVAGLCIAAFVGTLYWWQRSEERHKVAFVVWLIENRDELRSGSVIYEGQLVSAQDRIVSFDYVMSFVSETLRVPSRFYLSPTQSTMGPALMCTMLSLVAGWWALPFGPFLTFASVFRNLAGGTSRTIEEVLDELERKPPEAA